MVWPIIKEGPKKDRIGDCPDSEQKRSQLAPNYLDHLCALNINSSASCFRLSSIICTIGPSCSSLEMLEKMLLAGMNVARLDFSFGSYDCHLTTIRNIKTAADNCSKKSNLPVPVAIALDTRGPEIRTGTLSGGIFEVDLKKGETILLRTDKAFMNSSTCKDLYVDYPKLPQAVKPGCKIYLDYGSICLVVENTCNDSVSCIIHIGGKLQSRRGVNIPGVQLDLPAISEKDKDDIRFGIEHGVDIIFASFMRDARTVMDIKKVLGEDGKKIMVIAKIENYEGVMNIDEIIKAADGILVARGDLGIEIPAEKVFLAQKAIIAKCNKIGKPVICSTQMLDSMKTKPRPTRAEVSDVANAILDGADCVMLSGETAIGQFPLECICTMANVCKEAEAAVWNRQLFKELCQKAGESLTEEHSIAIAAVSAVTKSAASAIIIYTTSGRSARLIAKYRPRRPIIAVTRDPQVAKQLHLHRAICPAFYSGYKSNIWAEDVDVCMKFGLKVALSMCFVHEDDKVVLVSSSKPEAGFTNSLRIVNIKCELSKYKEDTSEQPPPTKRMYF